MACVFLPFVSLPGNSSPTSVALKSHWGHTIQKVVHPLLTKIMETLTKYAVSSCIRIQNTWLKSVGHNCYANYILIYIMLIRCFKMPSVCLCYMTLPMKETIKSDILLLLLERRYTGNVPCHMPSGPCFTKT